MGSWRRQHRHQYRRQPSPRHQNRGDLPLPPPAQRWQPLPLPPPALWFSIPGMVSRSRASGRPAHLKARFSRVAHGALPRTQTDGACAHCVSGVLPSPSRRRPQQRHLSTSRWQPLPLPRRAEKTTTKRTPAQEPRRQRPAARQPRERQRQPKTSEQRLPHWRLPLHWPLLFPLPLRSTSNAAVPRGREEWTPEACATMAAVAQQPWAMWPAAARAPRRAADRMDPAAMPRSSKAVRKAVRHALGDAQDCTMNDRT